MTQIQTQTDSATGGEPIAATSNRTETLSVEIGADELYPPNGLAAQFLRWAGKLHLSCNLSADALHWEIAPGHRIAFGGILSPWSAYDAVVQVVERDLFSESIRITTGPRRHLGLDQFVSLNIRRNSKTMSALTSGGQPSPPPPEPPEPPEPGQITRTILGPQDEEIPGATFAVGAQTAASGGSISLPPGSYKVVYFVPPDFVPPSTETVNLQSDENNEDTRTATYRERLRLRRADGLPEEDGGGQEIDLRVADVDDTYTDPVVKLRELYVTKNGLLARRLFLCSEAEEI